MTGSFEMLRAASPGPRRVAELAVAARVAAERKNVSKLRACAEHDVDEPVAVDVHHADVERVLAEVDLRALLRRGRR